MASLQELNKRADTLLRKYNENHDESGRFSSGEGGGGGRGGGSKGDYAAAAAQSSKATAASAKAKRADSGNDLREVRAAHNAAASEHRKAQQQHTALGNHKEAAKHKTLRDKHRNAGIIAGEQMQSGARYKDDW